MTSAGAKENDARDRRPSGESDHRLVRAALPLAVAGIVLAPYLTTTLPHRHSLVVQAVCILGCAATAALLAISVRGWGARLRATPLPVRTGMALYAATAAVAAVVGLARGNEAAVVAGQLLSMGLLPLGFLAVAASPAKGREGLVAWSLPAAVGAAAVIHFVHWGVMLRQGRQLMRLYMGNSVSVTGASLLALLVAVALARGAGGWRRTVASTFAALVALFIVGSGTRSLWLVTLLGMGILIVRLRLWRSLAHRRAWGILAAAATLLAVAAGGLWLWWRWPRENLLPDATTMAPPFFRYLRGTAAAQVELPSGPKAALSWRVGATDRIFALTQPLRLPGKRLYRGRALLRTDTPGTGRLGVAVLAVPRTACAWHVPAFAVDERWQEVAFTFDLEGDLMIYLVAGTEAEASGTWWVAECAVEDLGPAALAVIRKQLDYLAGRLRTTMAVVEEGPTEGDENAAFRVQETLAVWRQIRAARVPTVLLGHGLGARYRFGAWGWSDTDERVFVDEPNYIHNFYAFLLFKTGVVGTVAVLLALALWLVALGQVARTADAATGSCLADAAFAALTAYLLWSLACPEILDFRVAPLWGLVIGAFTSPAGTRRDRSTGPAPAERPGVSVPVSAGASPDDGP